MEGSTVPFVDSWLAFWMGDETQCGLKLLHTTATVWK